MDITSKIIYAKTKAAFQRELPNIPIGLNPIVFIEDTREMWTMGNYFSIGYPSIVVSETGDNINVAIGNSSFDLSTSGDALSIRKGTENRIILTSTALTKVDTSLPLFWDIATKKLLHSTSGVTQGTYGQTTTQENASIFTIPYFSVDNYGHINEAGSKNIEIRDYVEQLSPTDILADRNILLSYNEVSDTSDTAQTRKARGLTFNDSSGVLKVSGGINVSGPVNIDGGDMTVKNGYIVGDLKGNVTGSATPKIHLSDIPEYGGASTELYGHVKVQDNLGVTAPEPSSTNIDKTSASVGVGIAASPLMVWNVKKGLEEKISAAIGGISGIGGISVGDQILEITTPGQVVEILASNGINASIVDGVIVLKGINMYGYDEDEIKKTILNNITFGPDFVVDSSNEASLRWLEIN